MSEETAERAKPPAAGRKNAGRGDQAIAPADLGLYAGAVLIWGASWFALKLQLGVVAPEVSVFWRFAAAALLMLVWVRVRGLTLRFPLALHLRFVALGACLFCFNFYFFYLGGRDLPSGLLSVVFSMTSVINLFLSAIFLGSRLSRRALLAAFLGVSGIVCLFWPEVVGTELDWQALAALGSCLMGTTIFCIGNIVSVGLQRRSVPIFSSTAWGMIYGAAILGLMALLRGKAFEVEMTASYLLSLAYLAVFASVLAFACYLTLLGRIGAGRAGYATVIFPIVALAISSVMEGYSWPWIAIVGVVLALSGNLLILTGRKA